MYHPKQRNKFFNPNPLPYGDDDFFMKRNDEPALPDNQLMLTNGKIITFNDEQYEGIDKIRKWLKNGQNFFTLAGYAGTGKSTIIKKILDEYHGGVVVSAPTHKAKKVIANTTKKDAQTLHALLGLRPDVELAEFNPNSPIFNQIAMARINDYNFVIIDEASMVNDELYNLILTTIKGNKTKILFMGDPAQIPPVGERESVVFNQASNEFHQLTKIERQNDTNPLAFVYDALRNNLYDPDGGFLRRSNMNDLGEGVIFTLDKQEFRAAILEKYRSPDFKKDTDFVKVIAYTNKTVMASNKVIRNELLGEGTDIVEVGDILMGYRSVTAEQRNRNIIENSADYHVMSKSGLGQSIDGINGFMVKLRENLAQGEFKFTDVFIVDTNDINNLHFYGEKHDYYRDMGKVDKKKWTKYYDFRRNNLLMTTIDTYRNGLARGSGDVIVKDLDYGYCITAHKAQGSTYTHVFVLENDISINWKIKERNQIKYVAFTRPSISAMVLTTKLD